MRARARLDFAGGVSARYRGDLSKYFAASERVNERTNEQVSELSNSAKVARRLWKLMSRTVHALVSGSLLFLSLIFVGEQPRVSQPSLDTAKWDSLERNDF